MYSQLQNVILVEHVVNWISVSSSKVKFSAFDISEKLIEENKIKWPEVTFYYHNIYEPIALKYLPEKGKFDLLICSEVLEHMARPKDALKNLMLYGNKLIISVPHEPIWRVINIA